MSEATTPQPGGGPKAAGVVFDIGYQRYSGPREGRRRARLAVYKDGIRKALGLGRGARTKLLPWAIVGLLVFIATIMAVMAGAGQRALGDTGAELLGGSSHPLFYTIAITILFLFAALVAPRLLCPDRRNGTLHLYLVRPLTSTDYLAARWAAFLTVMLLVAWLPQFVVLLGRVLGHPEPLSYLDENWTDIPKFLLSGAGIAAVVTTVAMFASGLATRRGYASVLLIALYLVPSAVTAPLSFVPELQWVSVFDLRQVLGDTNALIFQGAEQAGDGEAQPSFGPAFSDDVPLLPTRLPPRLLLTAFFVWLVAPGAFLWRHYRRMTL